MFNKGLPVLFHRHDTPLCLLFRTDGGSFFIVFIQSGKIVLVQLGNKSQGSIVVYKGSHLAVEWQDAYIVDVYCARRDKIKLEAAAAESKGHLYPLPPFYHGHSIGSGIQGNAVDFDIQLLYQVGGGIVIAILVDPQAKQIFPVGHGSEACSLLIPFERNSLLFLGFL